MRKHADFYKQFIEVNPGGGTRRNPKRKNAGAYSTPFNAAPPTAEEIDRVFEGHLKQMAQGGTYGDNMEITAFCRAFNVDVKIYQAYFAYMVPVKHEQPAAQVVHIAYHVSIMYIPSIVSKLTLVIDLGTLLVYPQYCWTAHWPSFDRGYPYFP